MVAALFSGPSVDMIREERRLSVSTLTLGIEEKKRCDWSGDGGVGVDREVK